ncbi:unnamed protein product [Linum trigynum]
MASFLRFLLFLSISLRLSLPISSFTPLQDPIVLPVSRDSATLQYTTVIRSADSLQPIKLAVDLGGPALWLDCDHHSSSLLRRNFVPSRSIHCSAANSDGLLRRTTPGACVVGAQNGVVGSRAAGQLAEGAFAVGSTDGSGSTARVDRFLFSCGSGFLLSGLASGAVGMMGLGRTRISPPAQFASAFDFRRRFAVCLSSEGFLAFGDSPSESILGPEISKSLLYTPLVISSVADAGSKSPAGHEYFINLKSIRVNGERVYLGKDRIGLAKLSTTVPYTLMETSVYRALTEAYLKAAAANNMTRTKPISPFAHCFRSTNQSVPVIDIALQSEMVKWRIQGRNSMVSVKGNGEEGEVVCLGFLDGGSNLEASVVIGGLQLEDRALEFDLDSSRLGFSSSLSMEKQSTPCSSFVPRLTSS